jgi:DNA-binding HxlR family transcriptional regulator
MPTRTAAQRRTEAKHAYNAYLAECPSRQLLDSLSDKWVTLVLCALGEQESGYSMLGRKIPGVSQKMLSQTLRTLERNGLVHREVTPSVPVRVDYTLTPLGRSLLPVIATIKHWAEDNMKRVHIARGSYDATHEAATDIHARTARRAS